MRSLAIALVFLLGFLSLAGAVEPGEALADPALEARARNLSAQLRCMVCQNQSIDDSDAELARDLRLLVRERIAAGDTDEAVIEHIVARYGEFVLLRPRFSGRNLLLWTAPALLLLAAALYLLARRRRSPGSQEAASLSSQEEERLQELLNRRD